MSLKYHSENSTIPDAAYESIQHKPSADELISIMNVTIAAFHDISAT